MYAFKPSSLSLAFQGFLYGDLICFLLSLLLGILFIRLFSKKGSLQFCHIIYCSYTRNKFVRLKCVIRHLTKFPFSGIFLTDALILCIYKMVFSKIYRYHLLHSNCHDSVLFLSLTIPYTIEFSSAGSTIYIHAQF